MERNDYTIEFDGEAFVVAYVGENGWGDFEPVVDLICTEFATEAEAEAAIVEVIREIDMYTSDLADEQAYRMWG